MLFAVVHLLTFVSPSYICSFAKEKLRAGCIQLVKLPLVLNVVQLLTFLSQSYICISKPYLYLKAIFVSQSHVYSCDKVESRIRLIQLVKPGFSWQRVRPVILVTTLLLSKGQQGGSFWYVDLSF